MTEDRLGSADTVIPFETSQELDVVLPNSTLIEYPNIGHQPMEEAADRFNRDLIVWLGALPP